MVKFFMNMFLSRLINPILYFIAYLLKNEEVLHIKGKKLVVLILTSK